MFNKKLLILALICILFIIPASFAGDSTDLSLNDDSGDVLTASEKHIYVATTGDDDNDGSESSPYATVDKAIMNANADENYIYIANGTYMEANMDINRNINIIGGGNTIIDADGQARIFNVLADCNIHMSNLTLANGLATDRGGAISIYQSTVGTSTSFPIVNLYLDSVKFINNSAYYNGGAIYNEGGPTTSWNGHIGTVYANNCEFISNSAGKANAAYYGGAIYSKGNTLIYNSTFLNNHATQYGYAIAVTGTTAYNKVEVIGNVFDGNYMDKRSGVQREGVLYLGVPTIDYCNINYNVFLNNQGHYFFYSSFTSLANANIDYNWYGTNNIDINLFNQTTRDYNPDIHTKIPNTYATFNVTTGNDIIKPSEITDVIGSFYWNGTDDNSNVELFSMRNITLTTTGGNLDETAGNLINGKFTTNFSSTTNDKYTVTGTVDGVSSSVDIFVVDNDVSTTIDAVATTVGSDVNISVTVRPGLPGGNVTFRINGRSETIFIENGKGSILLHNILDNFYMVDLSYNGADGFKESTGKVDFTVNSTTKLLVDANVTADSVYINVTVEPNTAEGNVTFKFNDEDIIINLENGRGNFTLTDVEDGEYSLDLTYNGEDRFESSTNTLNFTVNATSELSADARVDGDGDVIINITVKPADARGNVTFTINGEDKIINLRYSSTGRITVSDLPAGNYSIELSYNGDDYYRASTKTVEFTVSLIPTELTSSVKVNRHNVVIDVELNNTRATGNVTFKINGEDKLINITKGRGSISLSDIKDDNYTIELTYNGDEKRDKSSYTLEFTVDNNSNYGEILYVSKTGNDDNNASKDSPLLTFTKAVEIANAYEYVKGIVISKGTYLSENLTLESNITITGEDGVIIDGNGFQILAVTSLSNVNISSVKFINGVGEDGGAIYSRGNMTIEDCVFENNTAYEGGAIAHFTYNKMIIKNTEFYDNTATLGGAIYAFRDEFDDYGLEIDNCIFENNIATSGTDAGGAIYNNGFTIVNNTKFYSNRASAGSAYGGGTGGAIYNNGGSLILIDNSEFSENHALFWGGAIKASGVTYIINSNFTHNTAGARGGAIHASSSSYIAVYSGLYVENCNFDNNYVGYPAGSSYLYGGAICSEGIGYVYDSTFTSNDAVYGGAVYAAYNYNLFDNSTFTNNTADYGGAIYNYHNTLDLNNSYFEKNTAVTGAALSNIQDLYGSNTVYTNVYNNTFINNNGVNGTAIYSDYGTASASEFTVKYNEFINNTATGTASVLYVRNRGDIEYNAIISNSSSSALIYVGSGLIGITSLEYNWWGENDIDLYDIIKGPVIPEVYAVLNSTVTPSSVNPNEKATVKSALYWNDATQTNINLIPARHIELSGNTLAETDGELTPGFQTTFSNSQAETYLITVKVDNEVQYLSVKVLGEVSRRNVVYANASTGNDKTGDGSAANPVATISRAIDLVNDNGTIILTGEFTGSDNTNIALFGFYRDNITFVGMNGASINGQHKNQLFVTSYGTYFFENLTFKNAKYDSYGSALINSGYTTLTNCIFDSNTANGAGAIDNDEGTIVLIGCRLTNNVAISGDAGALSSNWVAVIINTTFEDNFASKNGGSIKNYEGGEMYVINSTFTDNSASGSTKGSYGGAIYSWQSYLEVDNSTFTDNYAITKAGAIYASYGNTIGKFTLDITGCEFINNNAESGGAIYAERVYGSVKYNAFVNNTLTIYAENNNIDFENNWWGVNDPNWSSLLYGGAAKPKTYAVLNATVTPDTINTDSKADVEFALYWNGTSSQDKISLIPIRNITLNSTGGQLTDNAGVLADGNIKTQFSSKTDGIYNITGTVDNQKITLTVNVAEEKPEVTVIDVNVAVSENSAAVNINLTPDDINDNVTVNVGGKTYNVVVAGGKGVLTISDLENGNYTAYVSYNGDRKHTPANASAGFEINVRHSSFNITAPELVKYFKDSKRFEATVKDIEGNPVANVSVIITVNGNNYTRQTNENGTVSMAINLNSGEYNVTVRYNDTLVNTKITVLATTNGTDIVKVFRNATQYYATFKDFNGDYLSNGVNVTFNINGVMYTRQISGDKGLARLNINLNQGNYTITAVNPVTGEYASNNIEVIPKLVNNNDLEKYYKNASQYTVAVLGDDGKIVGEGVNVIFNINGVFYSRQTNASGIAKLSINLNPGDYIITAEYANCKVSNNIKVKPVLSASDLTKTYGTADQFKATLLDGQGKAYADQSVAFNINGVLYYRTTDDNGIARLNINLMAGKYIITSSYAGTNIANTITVS